MKLILVKDYEVKANDYVFIKYGNIGGKEINDQGYLVMYQQDREFPNEGCCELHTGCAYYAGQGSWLNVFIEKKERK